MLNGLREWLVGKRARRRARLLAVLAASPTEYQPTDTLAKATGLENVVYPLLADLSRRGWVEHRWLDTPQGPRLAYRLSPEGCRGTDVGSPSGDEPSTPERPGAG